MKSWRTWTILALLTGACGGGGTTAGSDSGTTDGSMTPADAAPAADAAPIDSATADARTPDATIQADAAARPTLTVGVAQTGTLPTNPRVDLIYEFTPTAAGMYTVTLMSTGSSSAQFQTAPASGGCFVGSDCCLAGPTVNTCSFKTLETLLAGTKYYVIVNTQGTGGQSFTLTVTGPS